MPIVRAYATSMISNPGNWVNPNNAIGSTAGTTTTSSPARNNTAYVTYLLDPAPFTAIKSDATLAFPPTIITYGGVNTTNQKPVFKGQFFVGTTAIGTEVTITAKKGTVSHGNPQNATMLTLAHVRSGDLRWRIGSSRTGNQAKTFNVDYMYLEVNYTEYQGSGFLAWGGSGWTTGHLKKWDGTAWVGARVQRWNGSGWTEVPQ